MSSGVAVVVWPTAIAGFNREGVAELILCSALVMLHFALVRKMVEWPRLRPLNALRIARLLRPGRPCR